MGALQELVVAKLKSFSELSEAKDFFKVSTEVLALWTEHPAEIPVSAVEKVFDPATLVPKTALREQKKVCVVLPWYKSVNPPTAFTVMSVIDRAKMQIMLDYGDAFVAHTRNKLATAFLNGTMEWMFTVDDDMVIPFGNAAIFNHFTGFNLPEEFAGMNSIDRLLSHGKTLVGGLYFGRWGHGKPVYAEGKQEEALARRSPQNLLRPTRWVGTGCLLVHRRVFLDMEHHFPELARNDKGQEGQFFTSSEHDLRRGFDEAMEVLGDGTVSEDVRVAKAFKALQTTEAKVARHSQLGVGEDVIFCHRASQSGHQPHVDMGLVCGHVGSQVFGPRKLEFTR